MAEARLPAVFGEPNSQIGEASLLRLGEYFIMALPLGLNWRRSESRMIISNSHNFIFCHIPKTAGESITRALDPHLGWQDVVLGSTALGKAIDQHYRKRFGLWKHSTAPEIRRVVGQEFWDQTFTFAVVRHPFHRIQSLYGYLGKIARQQSWRNQLRRRLGRRDITPWNWPEMRIYLQSQSFDDFIANAGLYEGLLGCSQARYLTESGKPIVKCIARFEHLQADIDKVCQTVGLPATTVPFTNASKTARKADLSSKQRSILENRFHDDLEIFGYSPSSA